MTQVGFYKIDSSEDKNFVNSFNLHEIINRISGDNTADFEMVGDVFKAEYKQTTAMRFKTSEFYDL